MEEIDEDLRQLRHVLNDAGLLRYGMLPHLVELACKVDARQLYEAQAKIDRLTRELDRARVLMCESRDFFHGKAVLFPAAYLDECDRSALDGDR